MLACRGVSGMGWRPRSPPLLRQRIPRASRRLQWHCLAHVNHSHSHSHSEAHHDSCCTPEAPPPQEVAPSCCGHDHSHEPDPTNPAHRLLKAAYSATRLADAAAWLEESLPATVAKIMLFILAAVAAGWAGSGWAASTAAAQAARTVSVACTVGVYLLAGLPAAVDLSYDLTAGKVDTHVLMNLAVVGTLCTGHALEGALLLVLFQTSHVVEHLLTDRAQGNLAALYDTMPKEAVLVGMGPNGSPELASARRVLAADVAVGENMLVKPGEQVPLDGTIIQGKAMVSSEHITGESLPVLCRVGDELAAGSLNRDGVLVLRALRPAEESTPARIAKLTLDAQSKRPQLRTWLDQFGELYSKGVIAASLGMLVVLLLSGVPLLGVAGQRGAFYRAMGLLTVASPCALVMVPLAYVSAIAAIASRGILVKGGRVLDALARCSTVAVDKTGTLTTGSLSCTSMRPLGSSGTIGSSASVLGLAPREAAAAKRAALGVAVALSLRSSHPVSDAVVVHGQQARLDGSSEDVHDFELVPGGGVYGMVSSSSSRRQQQYSAAFGSADFVSSRLTDGEQAAVEKLMAGQGTSSVLSVLVLEPPLAASSSNGHSNGGNGTASSSNGGSNGTASSSSGASRSVWVMTFEDSVRKQSATAVRELQTGSWTGRASQASRVAVAMLTGDNEASAQRVAKKLGITMVWAALSPQEKLDHVQRLSAHSSSGSEGSDGSTAAPSMGKLRSRKSGKGSSGSGRGSGCIMVGDGINDAPALAAADVGVAIASSATAAASLAADVIIVNSSGIAAIPLLLRIAEATQAVIRQNLVLAVGSILALSLPTVLGWVPLWFAVMLHEGSTLLVAVNSLRLLRFSAGLKRGSGSGSSSWRLDSQQTQAQRQEAEEGGTAADGADGGDEQVAGGWGKAVAAVPAASIPPAA